MERGVDTCRLIDFPVVASGQLPQPFPEWLGEANDQMLFFFNLYRQVKKIKSDVYGMFFGLGPPFLRISRESQRPLDVTCGAAILIPRWRRRKWRQPRPGAVFSIPIEEWGARWRPFRFRRPSWMTSFAEPRMRSSKMAAGSGRAAILLLTPR